MKQKEQRRAVQAAVAAARAAGELMRRNARATKRVNAMAGHDIKLELDVRCQKLIERRLLRAFPASAVFGEEGLAGDAAAPLRWVVDPIDGTVNYAYGIPHASVSIALQRRLPESAGGFQTVLGVVFDPFCDELWTAARGGPARLNGRPVRASDRRRLADAVVSIGFGKEEAALNRTVELIQGLVHQVRKIRILGSAALALTYVASGRLDAFLEPHLRLWDVAAGGLILECAGGEFRARPTLGEEVYDVMGTNGHLRRALERQLGPALV